MLVASAALLALCALFFLLLWRYTSRRWLVFTPLVAFGLTEIVADWPVSIYVQRPWRTGFYASTVALNDAYIAVLMALAFTAFLLGFVVVVFSRPPAPPVRVRAFFSRPVRQEHPTAFYYAAVLATMGLLIPLNVLLLAGWPPLLKGASYFLTTGDYQKAVDIVSAGRLAVTKSHFFGSPYRGQGAITTLNQVAWPFLLALTFLLYRRVRTVASFGLLLLVGVLAIGFLSGTGVRSSVLLALGALGITLSLAFRLRFAHILLAGLLVFSLLLSLTLLNSTAVGLVDPSRPGTMTRLFPLVLNRLTLGNSLMTGHIIALVKEGILTIQSGLIHWEKIVNNLPLPVDLQPFSSKLCSLVGAADPTAFCSATLLGLFYADFGPAGVIGGYLLVGLLAGLGYLWVLSRERTLLNLPLLGVVVALFSDLALSSLVSFVVNLVVLAAFYWLFRALLLLQQGAFRRATGLWAERRPARAVPLPPGPGEATF